MSQSETSQSTPSERGGKTSRRKRVVLLLAGLFGLYLLIGYLVVPRVVERELVAAIEAQTGVTPEVGAVSFDPFGVRLAVEGFALPDPRGGEPAVAFEQLSVDIAFARLFRARLALEEIALVGLRVSAVIDESGALNFLSFVPSDSEPAAVEDEGPPDDAKLSEEAGLALQVDSIRIERGALRFQDRSQRPPFDLGIDPLDLEVEGFTTRAGGSSPYALSVRVGESAELKWSGSIGLDPVRSTGEIEITGFDLRLPWDFLSDRLRFEVADGALDVSARYVFDVSDGGELDIEQARVTLRNLDIVDSADGRSVVALPSVGVSGITAAVGAEGLARLAIDEVQLVGGHLRSRLEPGGRFHLLSLLETLPAETDAGESAAAAPVAADSPAVAPEIRVERVAIQGFEIDLEDRGPVRAVPLRLAPLDLGLRGYRSTPGTPIAVDLRTGIGEGGALSLTGPVTLEPLSTELEIELSRLGLGPFQPYLEEFARVEISTGNLSAKLSVDFEQAMEELPRVSASGRVQIDDLLTVDQSLERKFLEWESLRLEGLDLAPDRIHVGEVALKGALAHLLIDAEGRSNLEVIFGGDPATEQAKPPPDEAEGSEVLASEAGSPTVEIGKVQLDALGATFEDRTLSPHFEISLGQLTGSIEGLSSEELARAKVDLSGRIDDVAPLRVAGQINPLSGEAYTDIEIQISGISMPTFTPYAGRFVGYRIDRGKLALGLDYKLNARQLEAHNLLVLDQFEFGEPVESDDATSLPVGLALALLRDSAGKIEIPLPIEGDLDDPSFSVLGLLGKALVNVLTKVATSPFAAVAGLVGASGDDLAQVRFASGSDAVSTEEAAEIEKLVTLLVDRPSLRLEIRGRANPAIDEPGLRRTRIEAALQMAAFQGLSERGREEVGDPANIELEEEERIRELERIYRERTGERVRDLIPTEELPPRGLERDRRLAAAAEEALAARLELTEADLRTLARARAAAVQGALLGSDQIDASRVFLVEVEVAQAEQAVDGVGGIPTELALRAR